MRFLSCVKWLILCGVMAVQLAAADFPALLHIRDNGILVFDTKYEFSINRFAPPDWRPSGQSKIRIQKGFPLKKNGLFAVEGVYDGFYFKESVQSLGNNRLSYSVNLNAVNQAVPCLLLFGSMDIPYQSGVSVSVNGKNIEMNPTFKKKNVVDVNAHEVVVSDVNGSLNIRGKFRVVLAGNFVKKSGNYYQLRIMPQEKVKQEIQTWNLDLVFEGEFSRFNVKSESINLKPLFNRALIDEKINQNKPGWTGQGPEMDLRSLKSGSHDFFNIKMNIASGDKACLVLSAKESSSVLPVSAKIKNPSYLYLLHASAWTPMFPQEVGSISVTYADGSSQTLPVVAGRDCGNWYKPITLRNAFVAWSSSVPSAEIGLALSAFPLEKAVKSLKFNGKNGMWMIVGAAFADGRVRFPEKNNSFIVEAGPSWLPIQFDGTTAAGSALDFSGFREMPAGKYGFIVANKEGHLVFEKAPGKRIRLFGPNLVGSANYLTKELAEDFITKAERLGYNTIRLHHYEQDLLNRKAPDSLTIDPKRLDQLQYLFARLKERGFYICIDLYASRELKAGDNIPEFDNSGQYSMKNLVCVSPAALENWKAFARKVLTVKNPYTGLSMAEDPALYALNLVNENCLISEWNGGRTCRAAADIILKKFEEYLKQPGTPAIGGQVQRNGLFIEFLTKLQSDCIEKQKQFLRNELNLKALITDLNFQTQFTLAGMRSQLDLVDNHQYWDHPSFPVERWKYPFCFQNQSSLSREAACPRLLMPTRVFGKPFTVTEFNFCAPNVYRVECPSIFGGYAALQDWDGLYRFAWSHGNYGMRKPDRILSQFDIVNNIQAQMAERIMYLLFVRGDVAPATSAIAFEFKPEQVLALSGNSRAGMYPDDFSRLGLWGRIGSLTQKNEVPGVAKVDPLQNGWERKIDPSALGALNSLKQNGVIRSSTGELTLDKKKNQLRIVTPRSEVVTGTGNAVCNIMTLDRMNTYQTVALQSLDGKNIVESDRLLLTQLTDLSNNKLRFDDQSRRVLRDWGTLPLMLERGRADVRLALPRKMQVFPLQLDGTPGKTALESTYKNGVLSFSIAADTLPGGTLAYCLTPMK